MNTLKEVAQTLQATRDSTGMQMQALAENTGLTAVTLRGLLTGSKDSRLTTLLAVADALGLAVLLVPKTVAASIAPAQDKPEVQTLVAAALQRKGSGQ